MDIDTRILRTFLLVAKYLSFTRAAEHLFVAQSAVSQQIKKLEEGLGVTLFFRERGAIRLTAVGKKFVKEAKKIVKNWDEVTNTIQQFAQYHRQEIKIGLLGQYEYLIISAVLADFQQKNPTVRPIIIYATCQEMEGQLLNGEIDVVIGSRWEFSSVKELEITSLIIDKICAIASPNDPLAKLKEVDVEHLKDQKIVMFNPTYAPNLFKQMISDCQHYGFEPNIVFTANTFDSMLLMIESGMGIAFYPSRIRERLGSKIVAVPIKGNPMKHELAVAKLLKNSSKVTNTFYSLLVRQLP